MHKRSPPWATAVMRVFRVAVRLAIPYRALQAENVGSVTGGFLIANHCSMADAPALYLTCPRPLAGPAKAELFRVPALSHLLRAIGAFPLQRDGMDFRAARTVADVCRGGGMVLVFPEGSRSRSASLLPFSPNLARLIVKLQAPIVPVGIAGTREVLPPGAWLPRRSSVVVAYGEPFELSEFYSRPLSAEESERAATIMRDRVIDALALAESERHEMMTGVTTPIAH